MASSALAASWPPAQFYTLREPSAAVQFANLCSLYVAPNQINTMHDCPPSEPGCDNDQKLMVGDQWVQQKIAPILSNPAFQQDGLLIITWDESWDTDFQNGGGHVLTIFAGSKVKSHFVSNTFYQHESLLRVISDALGVPSEANATMAPNMAEFFVGN